MFNDREKALILKFLTIRSEITGEIKMLGKIYLKHLIQFQSTDDVRVRSMLYDKMEQDAELLHPYVTSDEIRAFNMLLHDKCAEYDPKRVRAQISAIERKASGKRGATSVAV